MGLLLISALFRGNQCSSPAPSIGTCLANTMPASSVLTHVLLPPGFDPLDAHTSALLAALVVGVAVQEAMRVGAWVMHRCSSPLGSADGAGARAMLHAAFLDRMKMRLCVSHLCVDTLLKHWWRA